MEMTTITNLVLFGLLFLGTFIGFMKGFLEQALELAGAIASFVIAILMAAPVARLAEDRFGWEYSVALVIGFIVIVIAGLVATHLIALAIGRVVKMTILRMVDRFTGAALGLITAMVAASLLITVTLELPLSDRFRKDVATAEMSLFLRPIAAQIYNWIAARASDSIHFEEVFERGNKV
jgi:uncharacterized membrane protein required for colicin V production